MKFEWDETKASINLDKHGVSFEEATEVFADRYMLIFSIQIILKQSIVILLSARQREGGC